MIVETYLKTSQMNGIAPTLYQTGILVWSIDSSGLYRYFDLAHTVAVALSVFRNGGNPADVAATVAHRLIYAVPAIAGVSSDVPDDRDPVGYLSSGRFSFANGTVWELLADNDLSTWSPSHAECETNYHVCATENGLLSVENVRTRLGRLITPSP